MTTVSVSKLTGIPQQTVSYWLTTGLLTAEKGGRAWNLTPAHAMQALTVRELRDQGASLQTVREAVQRMESWGKDDWHEEWLFVDADGNVGWFNQERDQMVCLRDRNGYLVDVAGIRAHIRQRAKEYDLESVAV